MAIHSRYKEWGDRYYSRRPEYIQYYDATFYKSQPKWWLGSHKVIIRNTLGGDECYVVDATTYEVLGHNNGNGVFMEDRIKFVKLVPCED